MELLLADSSSSSTSDLTHSGVDVFFFLRWVLRWFRMRERRESVLSFLCVKSLNGFSGGEEVLVVDVDGDGWNLNSMVNLAVRVLQSQL